MLVAGSAVFESAAYTGVSKLASAQAKISIVIRLIIRRVAGSLIISLSEFVIFIIYFQFANAVH